MTTTKDLHHIADALTAARATLLRAIEVRPDPSGHLEVAQRYLHTAVLATLLASERCEQHHARPVQSDTPSPRRWSAWV